MKEQTMWMLWYVILGALPLLVSAMTIKELLHARDRAKSYPYTKR